MTIVLGGIGAAIGSYFGNPWLGWSIGASVGGYIDELNAIPKIESGKLSDLRYSGSSFGAGIPRIWGRARVGGNVIWTATDANGNTLVDHKRREGGGGKGGGGGGSATVHWYSATFAVAFCQGSIYCPDPSQAGGGTFVHRQPTVKRIWADDILIYDASKAKNVVVPTWKNGSELQAPDSTIVAKMGVSSANAPAYPGIAYAVFLDMNLEDFSNRIPNFSAEIETTAVTVADVFSDLCRSVGILPGQIDATAGAGTTVTGFMTSGRSSVQNDLNALLLAYGFDAIEVDGTIRLVQRGGSPILTVDPSHLGATTGDQAVKMVRTRGTVIELPGKMEVGFYDSGFNFLQGNVSVIRQSSDVQNTQQITLPLAMTADQARQLAGRELDRTWTETESYQFSLPPRYLKLAPGDVINLPVNGTNQRVRITQAGLAPVGEVRFQAVLDDANVMTQPASGIQGGSSQQNLTPVPSVWDAWSGVEVRDADQTKPGFYVAASGGVGWTGCVVYYSLDNGTNWIEGPSITGKCVFGTALTALSASGAVKDQFDTANTVDVTVAASGGQLSNADDTAIMAGNNHVVLGDEILAFGTQSLIAANQYRLSRLRRGERSSPMTGHVSAERFVALTPDIVRVSVADNYVGQTVLVKCVSRYQTLSDVTTSKAVIVAPRTLTQQEQILASVVFPNFIAPVTVASYDGDLTGTGGVLVDWTTFDCSAQVPATARAVILQWRMEEWGSVHGQRVMEGRANSQGQVFQIGYGALSLGDADFGNGGQVILPLDAGAAYRRFDWRLIGQTIKRYRLDLIGYWG